ncbi:MAG: hypothetical protein HY748_10395 [Elusimicrobia bacterium]|nr:hypothetical protein [Elusimicrobiota bacterium]
MDHIKIGLDAQSKLKDLEDKEKSRREAAFVSDISKRDLFLLTAWRDAHDKAQAASKRSGGREPLM